MAFVLGIILFAIGIGLSVALHEAGHMWAARATGRKVRRYYGGCGPPEGSSRRGAAADGRPARPAGRPPPPPGVCFGFFVARFF